MIIKNALVLTDDFQLRKKELRIQNGRIAEISDPTDSDAQKPQTDGSGCYLIPGLFDIHFHGCMGYDFCDATPLALEQIAAYELQHGITSICPASMTLSEEALSAVCSNAARYHHSWRPGKTSRLCGIHLEGPFISPEKKGAQNPDYIIPPDDALFLRLLEKSSDLVRLITVAPETKHALEFIQKFSSRVRISLGHTACGYDTAAAAFAAGARHLTHLYNAMPPFGHRSPGPIGAGMDAGATAEIICDGIHIAPSAVRAALAMFGDDRLIFISDSMRALGMPDGTYTLGGLSVHVTGSHAVLADGTLAGSATDLMGCVRTAVFDMNIPLETAVKCASQNPATAIGEDESYGSIAVGKYADLVLLDQKTLAVKQVFSHGIPVSRTAPRSSF